MQHSKPVGHVFCADAAATAAVASAAFPATASGARQHQQHEWQQQQQQQQQKQLLNPDDWTCEESVFRLNAAQALQQLRFVAHDLSSLDTSLCTLFNDQPNIAVAKHEHLVYYRSRVGRRINRYRLLTRRLALLADHFVQQLRQQQQLQQQQQQSKQQQQQLQQQQQQLQLQEQELQLLVKQHQQRLQTYKSNFAAWWQQTERHFHAMRMANYVCSIEENNTAATGAAEGSAESSRVGGNEAELGINGNAVGPDEVAMAVEAAAAASADTVANTVGAITQVITEDQNTCALYQKQQNHHLQHLCNALTQQPLKEQLLGKQQHCQSTKQMAQQQQQQALMDSKKLIDQEVQRMQRSQQQLHEQSTTLESTDNTYSGMKMTRRFSGGLSASSLAVAPSS